MHSTPPARNLTREATALRRLIPRLKKTFADRIEPTEWETYSRRIDEHFPELFRQLFALYGHQYDFYYHLEGILTSITEMWLDRSSELKALDALREADPHWYQSQRMTGAMCYVDLFADNLKGVRDNIPYLTEMGITYLHLMPIFRSPKGDNDGGYAVSSYREVNPDLGTMEELADLAGELRHRGISLCLDFVLNHTSDEHEWARKALLGDEECQEYYRMYPDRTMPAAFEKSMGAIFPEEHPGAFTYRSQLRKWIWTTFHNYQWDLNYENPALFNRMIEEALFLANQGVEILRMDAVAFLWKRLGTTCQNLPEAHWVLRAMNAAVRIAAPAMVFKSEAIVHPDDVRSYISEKECQLSYNPQLMALLWNSLATRETRTLRDALEKRFKIDPGCEWVNYVRCHDDIGWAFSNEDVEGAGFDANSHRRFLTDFYCGKFKGTFASGLPFQEDPTTGDARVSGTCASLAGLEKAIAENDEEEIDLAIRRIHLLHGVIMTIGGIPLIYLGDGIASLNDYSYEQDVDKMGDTRWVHRGQFDWERAKERHNPDSIVGRVYEGILRLVHLRHQTRALNRAQTEFVDAGNSHVLGYFRNSVDSSVLVLANFSESPQQIEGRHLRMLGLRKTVIDILAGQTVTAMHELSIAPYQMLVLMRPG
ncbi:cyclomaltodextrinase C-terminal domain-containing protein [Blastopirellula sp. JC732]|uniref:Cyclomaltodextrinase C-terminal domain-containing protein n=1 Tax=Blastopirellula sediminis TaxID=2894196 RepID=A0A9X1MHJ8_9BACT|nr:amylosucrase [Blastopirellula sediminis]MCC9607974.1 cyclomaltodextrinase C-terminal domain-containing protein [Blastopirellula sediminis]MCC9627233.1 cyclomaltodextrinase C-terminal domain-containing protein [Blastopirellula sediminis]